MVIKFYLYWRYNLTVILLYLHLLQSISSKHCSNIASICLLVLLCSYQFLPLLTLLNRTCTDCYVSGISTAPLASSQAVCCFSILLWLSSFTFIALLTLLNRTCTYCNESALISEYYSDTAVSVALDWVSQVLYSKWCILFSLLILLRFQFGW